MKKIFISLIALTAVTFILTSTKCSSENSSENRKKNDTEITDKRSNVDEQNNTENNNSSTNDNIDKNDIDAPGKVVVLDNQKFIKDVFDYKTKKDWEYQANKPCVIDFYADWCGPCKMVAPIMDELAAEYEGEIIFYKLDVDANQEVASVFGIQSIPSVLFVPVNGQPQMAVGAMKKDGYINAINQVILGEK